MENLYDWKFHQHPTDTVFITGDSDSILGTLYDQHRFFIDNYLDDSKYLEKKLLNYKRALRSYCQQRSIKLIDINMMDEWKEPRHPTVAEHSKIARKFYQKFYNMD
jgi:dsRNA-specific ribonuclease